MDKFLPEDPLYVRFWDPGVRPDLVVLRNVNGEPAMMISWNRVPEMSNALAAISPCICDGYAVFHDSQHLAQR